MTTSMIAMDWVFDRHRWAEVLQATDAATRQAAQELSGLSETAWLTWMNPQWKGAYEHPGMLNFLNVCNLLDLDPREFFSLDVKGI